MVNLIVPWATPMNVCCTHALQINYAPPTVFFIITIKLFN